jgi:hypothetical protein
VVQWTTDGTQAATDIIRLFFTAHPIVIHPNLCSVTTDGTVSATTATLDIGDDSSLSSPDADRYADGLNVQAAGMDLFTDPAVPAGQTTPHTTGAAQANGEWIDATIATLTGAATNGTVATFRIVYSIN